MNDLLKPIALVLAVGTAVMLDGCQSSKAGTSTGASATSGTTAGGSASSGGASSGGTGGTSGGGTTTGGVPVACPAGSLCTLPDGGVSLCCAGACVDLLTDSRNCGGCGGVCPGGSECHNGGCFIADCAGAASLTSGSGAPNAPEAPVPSCNPEKPIQFCCNGSCIDDDLALFGDAGCGGCGLSCPQGSTCQAGGCGTPGGTPVPCSAASCPSGSSCVVGNQGPRCVASTCNTDGDACPLPTADQGLCCGGACVDQRFDSANCLACGQACELGQVCVLGACLAAQSCDRSSNGRACALSTGRGGTCCAGGCVDVEHDADNCGACGAVCPGDGICSQMACVDPTTLTPLPCYFESDAGATCPAGTACLGLRQCQSLYCSGDTGEACASGICCAQGCTNPLHDPANCGGCGVVCDSGLCVSGTCMPVTGDAGCPQGCPSGASCLNGLCLSPGCETVLCAFSATTVGYCCDEEGCVDPTSDPQNCGGCQVACPSGQTCSNGVCSGTPTACLGGNLGSFCNLDAGFDWICCQGTGCIDVGNGFCPL